MFFVFLFLMIPRPPRSPRPYTLVPYTTLCRPARVEVVGGDTHLRAWALLPSRRGNANSCTSLRGTVRLRSPLRRRLGVGVACGLRRSEEHTSELQSLMRLSYAVYCLKKKNTNQKQN